MSRIQTTFENLKAHNRKALIPFITAGFPTLDSTVPLMHRFVASGANIIELGIPFSDPSADGAVIQAAGDIAIANNTGLVQILEMVRQFRQKDTQTPVVLMGYANPIERYEQLNGQEAFARDAAQAGVDGVLVVDYPPEECAQFAHQLKKNSLDLIFLLAPTSTEARMAQIASLASGYVYYVSLKGVTGAASLNTAHVADMLPRIRAHMGAIPIGVGFGIRDAQSAQAVAQHAQAVIIGSKIIQLINEAQLAQATEAGNIAYPINANALARCDTFLREIRQALDIS